MASWATTHAALESHHDTIRQEHPEDFTMVGGDMNQGNLAATTMRALPQNRPSASAAELESADTFLPWMRTADLRLLCPTDVFQTTWQQYGTEDDDHKRVLDNWCCSKQRTRLGARDRGRDGGDHANEPSAGGGPLSSVLEAGSDTPFLHKTEMAGLAGSGGRTI